MRSANLDRAYKPRLTGTARARQVSEGGRVFDEGAVLVLAGCRAPLGRVEEVFGPVAAPLYALRCAAPGGLPEGAVPGALVRRPRPPAQEIGTAWPYLCAARA